MAEQNIKINIDEESLAKRIRDELAIVVAAISDELKRGFAEVRKETRASRSQTTTPTVSGSFNQRDRQGHLIAWTIFSPTRLVILCLDALGEHIGQLDLPDDAPPLVWRDKPATEALMELAAMYGRQIVRMPTGCLSVRRED